MNLNIRKSKLNSCAGLEKSSFSPVTSQKQLATKERLSEGKASRYFPSLKDAVAKGLDKPEVPSLPWSCYFPLDAKQC